ncbi:MAG: VanZ family protein [Elusimicrobia bacterium]|nr:VanZ family protein [Elusimicrobiota bacterium]
MALWCGVIFAFSSKTGSPGVTPGLRDLFLRKGAHLFEYGVLWLVTDRALGGSGVGGAGWKAFLLCALYGAGDEWHQSFVPFREGRALDVLIDGAGAGAAWLSARLRSRVSG